MFPKVLNPPKEPPKKRKLKIYKPILVLLLLAGIYILLFHTNVFIVKNIILDESLPISVAGATDTLKGKNIFLIKSEEIRQELLRKYPELTDIRVTRGLPDTIKIIYSERNPTIIWQTGDLSYLVDENGVIFKEIQGETALPKVKDNNNLETSIGKQVVTVNFISFVEELKSRFSDTGLNLDHFEINEIIFQLDAITTEKLKLKFDTTRTVDSQLSDFEKFWEQHKNESQSYIDLRVSGKVFYR